LLSQFIHLPAVAGQDAGRIMLAVRRGPLADSYLGAVALVICALIPFLVLTGAVFRCCRRCQRAWG
jgi:hypothetical protein